LKTVSLTRKPRGSGGERRGEILIAAEKIFLRDGYDGATVRKIAEDFGLSATALYMHFPDKRAMLMEIGGMAIETLLAESEAIAASDADPVERMHGIMWAHMRFALANRAIYQLIFNETPREFSGQPGRERDLAGAYYRTFAGVLIELARADRLHGRSPHLVAQTIFCGCHGLVISLITNPSFGFLEPDELMATLVEGLTRGLISEPGLIART
jgi:AcrR family transcriptional regulator